MVTGFATSADLRTRLIADVKLLRFAAPLQRAFPQRRNRIARRLRPKLKQRTFLTAGAGIEDQNFHRVRLRRQTFSSASLAEKAGQTFTELFLMADS
jgi:hypothetical protein